LIVQPLEDIENSLVVFRGNAIVVDGKKPGSLSSWDLNEYRQIQQAGRLLAICR
jgi:hypothetical protein